MSKVISEEEKEMLSPEEREALEYDNGAKSPEELAAEAEAAAIAQAKEDGAGAAQRVIKNAPTEKSAEELAAAAKLKEEEDQKAADAAIREKAEADKVAAEKAAAAKEAADKAAQEGLSPEQLEEAAKAKAAADAEKAAADQAAKEAADKEAVQKAEADASAAEAKKRAEDAAKVADSIQPPGTPPFVLKATSKHGTVAEIEAKMVDLDTTFEDGDIKLAEYNATRAEYVEDLTKLKMFDTINQQVQEAAAEEGWKKAQIRFFTANPEYSLERIKNVSIVDAVNRLLQTEESKQMTDDEIFAAAKKECDVVFHPAVIAPTLTKEEKEAADKKAAGEAAKKEALEKARKEELAKAGEVQTLARVPVSQSNMSDDKYDALDKLSGEAFEEAVAKLSETERAAYAAR